MLEAINDLLILSNLVLLAWIITLERTRWKNKSKREQKRWLENENKTILFINSRIRIRINRSNERGII